MQVADQVRVVPFEATAQKVGEQVVISEPFAVVVEPAEEQVAALDLLEYGLPAGDLGQPGGERPAQPFGDGGAQQEVEDVGFEGVEDVLDQVVADRTVSTGQMPDQLGGVVAAA